ncbi:MAG: hypothetical protein ACOYNI_12730 [Acidimicrobiia bacterium]
MDSDRKFFNQSQPQTLVIAQMLLYFNAISGLIFGSYTAFVFGFVGNLIALGALAAGAFGIANEKRWGYLVALAAAGVQLAVLLLLFRFEVFGFPTIITLLFDGALVALLLHPQSREYQKIWFK